MKKLKNGFKKLWNILRKPEMLILPGNLAFFLVLSLIPIVSLFGICASLLSLSTDVLINLINDFFPSDMVDIIIPFVDGSSLSTHSIVFTFVGFFVASNGPDSLIVASNLLYEIDNKPYLYRRIKALFMTFFLLLLFIFLLIFLAFGNLILNSLLSVDVIGAFIRNSYSLITFLKIVIAFFVVFIIIKILYTIAPDKTIKSKYVNRGTFFTTLSLLIVTSIYSYYVTNIADYNIIYGNLSNIIILILYVYIVCYLLVFGIAINSNYYKMVNNVSIDNDK